MSDVELLARCLPTLRAATVAAAEDILARPTDGSFLEKTLRDGLAARLPGAAIEQPLGLDRVVWPGRLGGVDVLYSDCAARIGVETKVWDVADSLYDLFKLAAGTRRGTIAVGFCVIAGRTRDWRANSAVRDLSQAVPAVPIEWSAADVLREHARDWTRIWSRTAIRPTEIPARLRTLAGDPLSMPRVPDHEIRIVGIEAIDEGRLALDSAGAAVLDA